MRRARKCAHRARPKSRMQMRLFLRAPVPWIVAANRNITLVRRIAIDISNVRAQ